MKIGRDGTMCNCSTGAWNHGHHEIGGQIALGSEVRERVVPEGRVVRAAWDSWVSSVIIQVHSFPIHDMDASTGSQKRFNRYHGIRLNIHTS